jgi:hypothetical protein
MGRAVVLVLGWLALAAAAGQQPSQPQAAVLPSVITVGDVFHAAIRLELPPGATVAAPDTLVLPPDLETAGSRELRLDTTDGSRRATLVYPLSAWRPGDYELPDITIALVQDGRRQDFRVALPGFSVSSVLPPDTAGVQPQPARDVLGANRLWWPILLALLLAALLAAALWAWWRRRARPGAPAEALPMVLPREAALARLDALAAAGHLDRGEFHPFYVTLTEVLRRYAATVRPLWSVDLTTTELAAIARAGSAAPPGPSAQEQEAAESLLAILATADLVKFARVPATADGARQQLDATRSWILRVDAPAAEPAPPGEGSEERRVA